MTRAVRSAVLADLARVREIRHGVRENRLTNPAAVTDEEVRWYLDEAVFLVAEDRGSLVGFGCANPLNGLVWALFVDPAMEGRGHGSALLDAMCNRLSEAGLAQAHLSTEAATRAAAFYERRGWRCTGRALSGELAFVKALYGRLRTG